MVDDDYSEGMPSADAFYDRAVSWKKMKTSQLNDIRTRNEHFVIPAMSEFYLPVVTTSQTLLQVRPCKSMGKVDFIHHDVVGLEKEFKVPSYSYSEGIPIRSVIFKKLANKRRNYSLVMPPFQDSQSKMVLSTNFIYNCYLQLSVEESEESGSVFTFKPPLTIQNLLFNSVEFKIGKLSETTMFQPSHFDIV